MAETRGFKNTLKITNSRSVTVAYKQAPIKVSFKIEPDLFYFIFLLF